MCMKQLSQIRRSDALLAGLSWHGIWPSLLRAGCPQPSHGTWTHASSVELVSQLVVGRTPSCGIGRPITVLCCPPSGMPLGSIREVRLVRPRSSGLSRGNLPRVVDCTSFPGRISMPSRHQCRRSDRAGHPLPRDASRKKEEDKK